MKILFSEYNSKWDTFFIREKIIQSIRKFFWKKKFHEVETPLLVPAIIPESYLEVFSTYLLNRKRKKKRMFLTASPEASIKKMIALGLGNCFEITKSFRNTEIGSDLHHPEFTILEWYRVNATYKDLMNDCEELFCYLFQKINLKDKNNFKNCKKNKQTFIYQNKKIDLTRPWERLSIKKAFKIFAGVEFDQIVSDKFAFNQSDNLSLQMIRKIAYKKGYKISPKNNWEEIFNQIFLNEVEPKLCKYKKPVFLYDYPKPLAALAKIKQDDPRFVERFELYIAGLELADCYTELTDANEQKRRFKQELAKIKQLKKNFVKPDNDYIKALENGLPNCSGIALGIDRIVMLFADKTKINEVIFFPLLN